MGNLKKIAAVLGVVFGSFALGYLFIARQLTLKNFGLCVEAQLIAQRIITPLLFVALGALVVSAEWFRRSSLKFETKICPLVKVLRVIAVIVLPTVIVFCTYNTPFWSYPPPLSNWDRPRFRYGWFLPWKGEDVGWIHMICPFLNLFFWTIYVMLVVGYRRSKHYLVMFVVMLVLFCLYAKLVGINSYCRKVRIEEILKQSDTGDAANSHRGEASRQRWRMCVRRAREAASGM